MLFRALFAWTILIMQSLSSVAPMKKAADHTFVTQAIGTQIALTGSRNSKQTMVVIIILNKVLPSKVTLMPE